MLEFLISPSGPVLGFQSLRQPLKNLFSIISPLVEQNIFFNPFADIPIHQRSLGINIHGNPITGLFYDATDIIIKRDCGLFLVPFQLIYYCVSYEFLGDYPLAFIYFI